MSAKLPSKKQSGKLTKSKASAKKNCDQLLWEARSDIRLLKEKGKIDDAESYLDRLTIQATAISTDCFNELLQLMSFFYTEGYVRQYNPSSSSTSTGFAKKIDLKKLKIVEDMHKRAVRRFRSLGSQDYELRHLKELVELYSWMDLSEQVLSACEEIFHLKGSNRISDSTFWYNTLLQLTRAGCTAQTILLMNKAAETDPSDFLNDTFFRFLAERIGETGEIWISLMASIDLLRNQGKLVFLNDADFYALNGKAQEKQGNFSEAVVFYRKAIEYGLKRPSIFKRCTILLEKQHDRGGALNVVDIALKNISKDNHSYSVEEDLLYRKARLMSKKGIGQFVSFVPCFKVREGNADIDITLQEKLRNSLTRLSVIQHNYRTITLIGMKEPVISAWDMSSGKKAWSTIVPSNLISKRSTDYLNYYNHGLQANDHGIVYWHMAGRVGHGYGSLLFLSTEGEILSKQTLPDKISQVNISGDIVAVGCRDGRLIAYNLTGELLWEYSFKQSRDVSPTFRECPYHVLTPQDGSRIACISYTNLYTFDRYGKLLWKWRSSLNGTVSNNISITSVGPSNLEHYYSALDLSSCASLDDIKKAFRKKVFETHPDVNPCTPKSAENFRLVYEAYQALIRDSNATSQQGSLEEDLVEPNASGIPIKGVFSADGNSITLYNFHGDYFRLDSNGKIFEQGNMRWQFHSFVAGSDGKPLASTDSGHVYFYDGSRLINLIPIHSWVRGYSKDETNELLAVWGTFPSLSLTVFRFDGTLLADIETARPIRSAAFLGNSIVAGTNEELFVLSVNPTKQVIH